jgi:starch synthase (maltosyl-transferring)
METVSDRITLAAVERIVIGEVRPHLAGGRHAVKRIVGERLRVTADLLREGHDTLGAEVRFRATPETEWRAAPMAYSYDDDEWSAEIPLERVGAVEYTVAAWTDVFASWTTELRRKFDAGVAVTSELLEGVALVRQAAARVADGRAKTDDAPGVRRVAGAEGVPGDDAPGPQRIVALPPSVFDPGEDRAARLADFAARIERSGEPVEAVRVALAPELAELMAAADARHDLTVAARPLRVVVDRERARFGAWYEFFPRSQGRAPGRHATFAEAADRLPAVAALGFDVLYLPPIHPIGVTNRKGRNNALVAQAGDPGSPWAIGNEHGGHDAVNPALGTLEDFDRFVAAARAVGLELALDLAIQCSPDHPYVRQHPEWFRRRPDGTIKYAENPPKKYEDIVALDLWCADYPALWRELKRVVLHWIAHGVEIFRVDNPHTKPLAFWEWLIAEVKRDHPGVIFLSEAFTRPKRVQYLAKLGFTQSYHYFTWRHTRREFEEYLTELTRGEQAEYLRPNFFTNTQDILTEFLQVGGRPAFKLRLALAATLSPTYGIYSGFELIENTPLHPGREEYLDSEKYELKWRDWHAPGNINEYIRRFNEARRANPALRLYTNLTFHHADNPAILSYSKISPDGGNRILVVANMDPFHAQEATVHLDGGALRLDGGSRYTVHDLLTGARYDWHGLANYVRLAPANEPVHLFRIE